MLRFHVGLFPVQAHAIAPLLIALGVIGILYGACLALVQRDYWRFLAFAAISHLGLITVGIYGFTLTGWTGATYQILNNEIIDAALFVLLGALEIRYTTSQIAAYGGLANRVPRLATLFVIVSLAMIGLPMLNGFIGEFLILSSTFSGVSHGWAIAATVGVILSAAYILWIIQRLFYGTESKLAAESPARDLNLGDQLVLWPIAVLLLIMGVAPNLWLRTIETAPKPIVLQQASSTAQPDVTSTSRSSGEAQR
jgi:NADH-quinone oxidoreductase subunit M